jgi:gluconate 2-dehydrogenase alpha chain
MTETALPMRELGSFKPGECVGGAAVHWGGQARRFLPWDFETRSHTQARYGKAQIPEDCTSQDWGLTYDELEPYYDQFEHIYGVCGKAGNLNGEIQPGGNPFEGPRAREYPNPPAPRTYVGTLFAQAAESLGYSPHPSPSAAMSQPYTNLYRLMLGQCVRGGFCSSHGCSMGAKASPLTTVLPALARHQNFELRPLANVIKVNLDSDKKRALGVTYLDARGREMEQPAELVILTSYTFNNVRLMLLSGIGKPYDPFSNQGVIGRNYSYQTGGKVTLFFEDKEFNPFIGGGTLATSIDDFNGDNFDQSGLHRRRLRGRAKPRVNADSLHPGAAGHAGLGRGLEEKRGAVLPPFVRDHSARFLPELPHALSRSRPDLPRRQRSAADTHDLRLA